jgi:hypothetical protein
LRLSPGRLLQIARRLEIQPADLVPELDAAVTPAAGLPATPAAARTGEPTPSPRRAYSPPPGPRSPPSPPPRTTPASAARWRCAASRPEPGPSPYLDILTQARRRALRRLTGAAILDDDLPASCLPGKPAPTPVCGHSPAGPPPKPNSWKPACPTASTARTKFTSATTSKFSLRYSDDGHIAASSASPLRWTSPQHIRPEVPRSDRVPASEHPGGAR